MVFSRSFDSLAFCLLLIFWKVIFIFKLNLNSSISLSLCSFQDLNHTDVRNFGMLRVYFLPFHFQPLRPVCFVLSNLYCPSWISLSQLESPVDSPPTESPFPASLVVLSFPLSLSAETAHLILSVHLLHHIVNTWIRLCMHPTSSSIHCFVLWPRVFVERPCREQGFPWMLYVWIKLACPVSQTSVACDSFSYLLLPLLSGLLASGSSRDSSCVWGWPLGVFLNFRPLFCAMHQNASHIYIICISVLFPDNPIARLSLCLYFIEYVCNRGDK